MSLPICCPLGGVVRFRAVFAEHIPLRPYGQQLLKLFCAWDRKAWNARCRRSLNNDININIIINIIIIIIISITMLSLVVFTLFLLCLLLTLLLRLCVLDGFSFGASPDRLSSGPQKHIYIYIYIYYIYVCIHTCMCIYIHMYVYT